MRESVVQRSDSNSTMLVTKALSQDVMVLAFVLLSLIPKESPSLHSNQPLHIARIFWDGTLIYSDKTKLQQQMISVRKRSVNVAVATTDLQSSHCNKSFHSIYLKYHNIHGNFFEHFCF
ncbi:hypothetical protein [Lysinibacillus sp. NPDC056232]|uniref:hypothetical protein n=1 Tax=Lysinibacillus sp. NPDC056232 TaxID=3345756 RepID=UPI0035D6476E